MYPILSSEDRVRSILISIVSGINDFDRDVANFTLPILIKEFRPYPRKDSQFFYEESS